MSLFDTIDISGSGLTAQRTRMDVIANNIANATTTRTTEGLGPYRRQRVIFKPRKNKPKFDDLMNPNRIRSKQDNIGDGVNIEGIVEDYDKPFKLVYDPGHPDAIKEGPKKGYVRMPNVDVVTEMVDMISASRAYEANVTVLNSTKNMMMTAINIDR